MMQSIGADGRGIHVAIIMDGNGRWAQARGLPRSRGHEAGLQAVRRTCEAASDLGVRTLTLFAFASANWKRPAAEVDHLMRLFRLYLRRELGRMAESGARLTVIGRRDRLSPALQRQIQEAEAVTAGGQRLHVRIAIDYSAREAIARAAEAPAEGPLGRRIAQCTADDRGLDEVDLLIRTGGEQRLSDFLLWEAAFAELWFTDRMWPDFEEDDLRRALGDFAHRQRRFGGLPQAESVVHAA
jgi:undecaprenyl diphosphate synthase